MWNSSDETFFLPLLEGREYVGVVLRGGTVGFDAGSSGVWFLEALYSLIRFAMNPDRKSTRLNSSHSQQSRMPSSA